jgi:hypothetical protein
MGMTGEGVRHVEVRALAKLRLRLERAGAQIDMGRDGGQG